MESTTTLVKILTMQGETIGERVHWIRKQKNWSMHQLAERIGTTHSYISQLEHGQIRPGIDAVIRLAEALGVSIDYLAGRADDLNRNVLLEASSDYVVGQVEPTNVLRDPPPNPILAGIQDDLIEIEAHDPGALEYIAQIVRAIKEKAERDHQDRTR